MWYRRSTIYLVTGGRSRRRPAATAGHVGAEREGGREGGDGGGRLGGGERCREQAVQHSGVQATHASGTRGIVMVIALNLLTQILYYPS